MKNIILAVAGIAMFFCMDFMVWAILKKSIDTDDDFDEDTENE